MYFTFSQVIEQPGKYIKIVAYPKWKFTCLVFFDVEVKFCCTPGDVADIAVGRVCVLFAFYLYQNAAKALVVKDEIRSYKYKLQLNDMECVLMCMAVYPRNNQGAIPSSNWGTIPLSFPSLSFLLFHFSLLISHT